VSTVALAVTGRRSARRPGARLTAGATVIALVVTVGLYTQLGSLGLNAPAMAALFLASVPAFVGVGALVALVTRRRDADGRWTLVLPLVALYAAFFAGPLILLCVFSVSTSSGFGDVSYGFSLDNFREATQGLYLQAFGRTLRFAVVGTVLTVLAGYPLAYWLARHAPARRRSLLLALIIVPFWTSFLIRTYSFLIVLSDDFFLADWMRSLGLVHGQLNILYTSTAVQIGIVYNYLPLFVLPAYAALERMDWSLVAAASDLGATGWTAFRQITLRLTTAGVLTGVLLVFIPMTGEYIIPLVLGGGKVDLVGNLVQRAFLEQQDYPLGAALGLVTMGGLSLVLVAYLWLSLRTEQRYGA